MDRKIREYLSRYDSIPRVEDDEEYKAAKKKSSDARFMSQIADIAGGLQGLGVLGGVAPKSSLPKFANLMDNQSRDDMADIYSRKTQERKDLLGRLDMIRGLEKEQREDRRRQLEEERRNRKESALEERRQEIEEKQRAREEERKEKERRKEEREIESLDLKKEERDYTKLKEFRNSKSYQRFENVLDSANILESQMDEVKRLYKSGEKQRAYDLAKTTLTDLNTLTKGSPDAIGAEEAKRLGASLERDMSNLLSYGSMRDIDAYVNTVTSKIDSARSAAKKIIKGKYDNFVENKYLPFDDRPRKTPEEQYPTLSAPVMKGESKDSSVTRSGKKKFIDLAVETPVGGEFEFNGKRFKVESKEDPSNPFVVRL